MRSIEIVIYVSFGGGATSSSSLHPYNWYITNELSTECCCTAATKHTHKRTSAGSFTSIVCNNNPDYARNKLYKLLRASDSPCFRNKGATSETLCCLFLFISAYLSLCLSVSVSVRFSVFSANVKRSSLACDIPQRSET